MNRKQNYKSLIFSFLRGYQRWSRSRCVGVESGRSLHFRPEQDPESIF